MAGGCPRSLRTLETFSTCREPWRAANGSSVLAMASFLERSTCTSCGQERNVTVRKMRQWSRDGPGTFMSSIFLAGVITAWKV